MIKTASTCLICLLIYSFAVSQQKITGRVVDSGTQKPLPYVNIGIHDKNIGTVSAEDGKFSLELNSNFKESDTIQFSYIGYSTYKTVYQNLKSTNNKVALKPIEYLIDEVAIQPRKMADKTFGRKSKGLGLMHWNFYSAKEKNVDDRLSKELGMSFKIREACRLNTFNFAISTNEFKNLKFRLNIYSLKEGKPDSLIISDNIIFQLKDQVINWYSVDLQPFKIYIDGLNEEILVTIQWVASEKATKESKYFAVPAGKSPFHKIYYREKAMDEWKSQNGNLSMYLDAKCAL